MPIEVVKLEGEHCTSCGAEAGGTCELWKFSFGYRLGKGKCTQSVKLCSTCLIFMGKAQHERSYEVGVVKVFGPEPYACLEDHDDPEEDA
jgi:hypothetical protein